MFLSPLPEYLRIIRENELRWRASAWGFAVSTVLMAVGLAVATSIGSRLFAIAAFTVFLVVAPCWLGTLALRRDLTVAAASGRVDAAWYAAIGLWSTSLYGFFMVGGHASVANIRSGNTSARALSRSPPPVPRSTAERAPRKASRARSAYDHGGCSSVQRS